MIVTVAIIVAFVFGWYLSGKRRAYLDQIQDIRDLLRIDGVLK